MNEREFSENSLINYLLGLLPDKEGEKFDEWSFTNENFSTALKSVENDLIDAYLHDQLSDVNLKRFDSYYLFSVLRQEKVNFAKSLQIYIEKNIAPVELETKNSVEKLSTGKTSVFSSWRFFANTIFGWSAVILVLLICGLSVFWINQRLNQPEIEIVSTREKSSSSNIKSSVRNENNDAAIQKILNSESSLPESKKEKGNKTPVAEDSRAPKPEKTMISPEIAVASFILKPPLRGGNQLPKISFSKETILILLTLKTEINDYKLYKVTLIDESNKKLWQSGNVRIRNETINISFPANLLKTRIYSMIVSGIRDDGETEIISNYPFRAMPK